MKNKRILLMLFMLIFFNCENKKGEYINIYAVSNGIKIENNLGNSIGYMLIEEEQLPLVDWSMSCHKDYRIMNSKSTVVDSTQILGYGKGKTIVVFYWNCPFEQGDVLNLEKIVAR